MNVKSKIATDNADAYLKIAVFSCYMEKKRCVVEFINFCTFSYHI